ncbi:hypothetical protein [Candidatus Poriferisodalis sp.]
MTNIVFVFFDNLGFGELGCSGGGVVRERYASPTLRGKLFG